MPISKVMTSDAFVQKAIHATECKTLYVSGCFGAPMNSANKARYSRNNEFNRKWAAKINAADDETFGFDCICLIKGILWGWRGDKTLIYGGAQYTSNGVPDIGEDAMIARCSSVSGDFSRIVPGAMLWMKGHAGIYIGNGLAVESTTAWDWKVQTTAVGNIGPVSGYHTRTWTKWGLLPWVDYGVVSINNNPVTLDTIEIEVDGENKKFHGSIVGGKTYIQLTDIDSVLGMAKVGWDNKKLIPQIKTKDLIKEEKSGNEDDV